MAYTTQASNGLDQAFTKNAIEIVSKCSEVVSKAHSSEVRPLHLMLVLLCGHDVDVDKLDQFVAPEQSTLLWSVIEDLEGDPLEFAKRIWKSIHSSSAGVKTVNGLLAPSRAPSKTKGTIKEKFTPGRIFSRRPQQFPTPVPSRPSSPRPSSPVPSNPDYIPPSNAFLAVITRAGELKTKLGDSFVAPYHLVLALADDTEVKQLLESQNLEVRSFIEALKDRKPKITVQHDDSFPYLAKFATDMTALAEAGKLNETIGRDEEIRRVIQILCRRTKNSAILLGEPGVGKTAVAEGLAMRIALGQIPQGLRGRLYGLDIGSLFAGAGKGEYEERVKGVIDDVMRSQGSDNPVILFIDEIHLITVGKSSGQNSGIDAANLLKPALAREQFRCIGATTLAEYREHIEKDGALERRFASVIVNEPTIVEALTILRGIRERYEQHHQKVWITNQAIDTAVKLAHRYLTARRLPDSAIDLLDEACASARVSQDMRPEVIDSLDKEKMHVLAYIKALERDNHPDEEEALSEARKSLADIDKQIKYFERQQKNMTEWWANISIKRNQIQTKKHDLSIAKNGPGDNHRKVIALEEEIKSLREGLAESERKGPEPVEGGDSHARGRNLSRTSPHTITSESIGAIVEKVTKIPIQRLLSSDKSRLLDLEAVLSQQVIGQPEAVKAVTNAIQVSRTGLGNANRPISSFLFTGPSGTGKTLLSKILAEEMFGQTTSMVRIDGSEYSQSHSISRLIGSPPGYVGYDQGGQLTEYVRRTPYCIVLLDEIEKTCPEFLTLFLQVLDEGRLTDGQGRLVDFRNCVIIMTSNVGSHILSRETNEISQRTRDRVMDCFKEKNFPLEFLNRIEEVVMFRTMSYEVMQQILQKHLRDLQEREGLKKLKLDLNHDAKKWLISMGISREYGARPLARVIQRYLLNPLSRCLLDEAIQEGDTVVITLNDKKDGLHIQSQRSLSERHEESVAGPSRRKGNY